MGVWINEIVSNIVNYIQLYGPWLGFLIIILESVLPFLPLFVFIALNVEAFGIILGFLISWSATIVGCILSYFFFRYFLGKKIDIYINKKKNKKKSKQLVKVINVIKNIKFSTLVLLMALPFSPAFAINIACGITNVNFRKFFLALLISKVSIIYFWGFIGTSLIDSIFDITILVRVIILLLVAFLISKYVMKKYNIE